MIFYFSEAPRRESRCFFVIYCLNNLKNVVFSCFSLRNILRLSYYNTTLQDIKIVTHKNPSKMKATDVKVKVKEIDRITGGSEWESTLYDLRSWELTEGQINEIMNGGSVKVSTERRSLLITKKEEPPQHPSKMTTYKLNKETKLTIPIINLNGNDRETLQEEMFQVITACTDIIEKMAAMQYDNGRNANDTEHQRKMSEEKRGMISQIHEIKKSLIELYQDIS